MSGGGPKFSVVVPVRDDPRVDQLLRSLAVQRGAPVFEVLVALDGSQRRPASPPGLPVRFLPGPAAGPYAARNRAIREAAGDVMLLTDSDCISPPDWIARAAAAFSDTTIDVLQGGSRPFEQNRLSLWIQREYDRYVSSHAASGYRRFSNTRNLGLRRTVALGLPFPETFERGGDGAYGLALEAAGIAIRYAPEWTILHRHSRTRLREGRVAFQQGRLGARWLAARGIDLFGHPAGAAPAGPGAWLLRRVPPRPWAQRACSGALLGISAALAVASFCLPGEAGYRAFSRFHRAAHMAGRLAGNAESPQDRGR